MRAILERGQGRFVVVVLRLPEGRLVLLPLVRTLCVPGPGGRSGELKRDVSWVSVAVSVQKSGRGGQLKGNVVLKC